MTDWTKTSCPKSQGEITVFVTPRHAVGSASDFQVRLRGPEDQGPKRVDGGTVTFGRLPPGNYRVQLIADDEDEWDDVADKAVTVTAGGQKTVRFAPTCVLKLSFHDVLADAEITATSIEQGALKKVEIRVSRNVGDGFSVKFYYKDARTKKQRPATRSVVDVDYRYLSRVRLATNDDGIRDPLNAMLTGDKTTIACADGAWAGGHLTVKTFTMTGLEWTSGPEHLVAEVYRRNTRLGRATLSVTVRKPVESQGAYRVWQHTEADHYTGRTDTQFESIYAVSGGFRAANVRLGICDTGIVDDSEGRDYLQSRIVAGSYFSTDESEDRATAAGHGHDHHILVDSPSKHGTNVAAQAAWGTTRLKLVDVMVQKGQMAADMNAETAARAFRWAGEQDVAVVNCSKIMPFNSEEANEVVMALEGTTLFMASGGNRGQCVPFHYGEIAQNENIRGRFAADFGLGDVPRNFANTLFVGGHNHSHDGKPCHHGSRGYGPGLDVMVFGDAADIYCPWDLTFNFRLNAVVSLRTLILQWLGAQIQQRNAEPEEVQGALSFMKQKQLEAYVQTLTQRALTTSEQRKYEKLQAEQESRPNPEHGVKLYLEAARALIESWTWPEEPAENRDDVVAFAKSLDHLKTVVRRIPHVEGGVADTWDGGTYGTLRDEANRRLGTGQAQLSAKLGNELGSRGFGAIVAELEKSRDEDLANDSGISFGLPVVSNIAGKLKLIRSALTPTKMRRILIDTSDYTPGFESECLAQGVVNPLRAYFAAFDDYVENGGTCPRSVPPVVNEDIEDARRVYYYFYYMDDEGKALYDAVKGDLKRVYAAANVDLVEAEPPIRLADEAVTYVTNNKINDHHWKNVVDVSQPLTHAPKHLRLILAKQCAHVEPVREKLTLTWRVDPGDWLADNPADIGLALGGRATIYSHVTEVTHGEGFWQCKLAIRDPDTRRIFPVEPSHILHALEIVGGGPIAVDHYTMERTSDTGLTIRVTDADTANGIRQGSSVAVTARVLQQIGGNRDGNNIFITNKYHAGPNGTAEADNSALVLFLHEIGHALGMVPEEHPEHYDNTYGGEGHHCGHNTVEVTNAVAVQTHGIPGDGGSGSVKIPALLTDAGAGPPCIMYHTRSSVHHQSVYCDECLRILEEKDEADWHW